MGYDTNFPSHDKPLNTRTITSIDELTNRLSSNESPSNDIQHHSFNQVNQQLMDFKDMGVNLGVIQLVDNLNLHVALKAVLGDVVPTKLAVLRQE